MKTMMAIALLVTSVSAFSASVKITSFNYVRTTNDTYRAPLAELCGVVEGASSSPSFVNVQIDHKTKNPASYNTVADANGKFCVAVITYRGTAEASVMGTNAKTNAKID